MWRGVDTVWLEIASTDGNIYIYLLLEGVVMNNWTVTYRWSWNNNKKLKQLNGIGKVNFNNKWWWGGFVVNLHGLELYMSGLYWNLCNCSLVMNGYVKCSFLKCLFHFFHLYFLHLYCLYLLMNLFICNGMEMLFSVLCCVMPCTHFTIFWFAMYTFQNCFIIIYRNMRS